MKQKAAIPVPYIIALILGIIVVVVLGYWLIFSGGRGGEVITSGECKARMLAYCLEKKTTGGAWDDKSSKACGGIQSSDICCTNYTILKGKGNQC